MNACLRPPFAGSMAGGGESALRAGAEEICGQLCGVVTGDFSFRIETVSADETAQKLAMLSNFVLGAARRAVEAAEARASELQDAHRVARIGSWRRNLLDGSLTLSPELHALFGTDPDAGGPGHGEILAMVHPEDRAATAAALQQASGGAPGEHEWRMVRADGTVARFWAETRVEHDAAGLAVAVRGVCQDVTERHATTERIYRLAHHDALTGLVNRILLHERLDKAVARGGPPGLAVLCLDLDGFKAVNDLYGHAMGDCVLREAGARLLRSVRDTDTVARLGGDEFVVVQDGPAQPAGAQSLAERLVAVLAEPYDLGSGLRANVTASVGVALFPDDGHDTDTLLRNADTALYRAKWAGKNGSAFFRAEMDRELRERRALEHDLRHAAERGEFSLVWQPLSAPAGGVTGFEVLLRWRHPERGMVSPGVFIPVAEASGTIMAIGAWVLREACAEAAGWAAPLRVAVNVSPVQAQAGGAFATMVEDALAQTGLDPSRLELEVTEGVLIRDADTVLRTLRRLKALGVRVALDDFGTGYSSLATLRAFPFDKLKIDQSFVSGVAGCGQDAAIVRAVLGLARGLHLPVVAEGVETEDQLNALLSAGCEEVQGWLIGRPAPIETFSGLVGKAPTPTPSA